MKTNNKANTGLIFELLSQQITDSGRNNDEINVKKALYLIRKYFHKGTQIYEELSIFNTVLYNQVNRWETASRLLTEVLKASKELDQKKLKDEKYHMLQEILANFDRNTFFKRSVPQFKLYSSIYALMEDARGNHKIDITEKVLLEESICKHLTDNKEVKRINEFAKKAKAAGEPEIDDLTFFFIIKKFNEKYDKVLSTSQKMILNEYIRCTSEKTFDQFVGKQTKRIEGELYNSMKTVGDKGILQKLYESMLKLGNIGKLNKSQKTEALMTYQNLLDELKKLKKQ